MFLLSYDLCSLIKIVPRRACQWLHTRLFVQPPIEMDLVPTSKGKGIPGCTKVSTVEHAKRSLKGPQSQGFPFHWGKPSASKLYHAGEGMIGEGLGRHAVFLMRFFFLFPSSRREPISRASSLQSPESPSPPVQHPFHNPTLQRPPPSLPTPPPISESS